MKLYVIKDEIYNSNLGLCIGNREEFNEYITNCGIPDDFKADGCGKYIIYNNQNLIWIEDLKTIEDMGILLHELLHHCVGLFTSRGIPVEPNNDEAMCYYQEMMFKNICSAIKIKRLTYERPKVSTKTKK